MFTRNTLNFLLPTTKQYSHFAKDWMVTIWIGTWAGGLVSYVKKTKKSTTYPLFIAQDNATIVSIYEDVQKNIWIGTYGGGLFCYNKQKNEFKNYNTENGLSSNNIYTIFQDSKNDLWVGTEGGGVNKINLSTGKIIPYTRDEKENSISSNSINHIYEDNKVICGLQPQMV